MLLQYIKHYIHVRYQKILEVFILKCIYAQIQSNVPLSLGTSLASSTILKINKTLPVFIMVKDLSFLWNKNKG